MLFVCKCVSGKPSTEANLTHVFYIAGWDLVCYPLYCEISRYNMHNLSMINNHSFNLPFIHPCIHLSMHPCIHACMHPCMHPFIHACIHCKNIANVSRSATNGQQMSAQLVIRRNINTISIGNWTQKLNVCFL